MVKHNWSIYSQPAYTPLNSNSHWKFLQLTHSANSGISCEIEKKITPGTHSSKDVNENVCYHSLRFLNDLNVSKITRLNWKWSISKTCRSTLTTMFDVLIEKTVRSIFYKGLESPKSTKNLQILYETLYMK